jgi:gluconate 2-dehydrogenase gamma chain
LPGGAAGAHPDINKKTPGESQSICAKGEEISMSKHDESRRAFLVGAAVGAGTVAGAGLVPDALAQGHPQHTPAGPATAVHAGGPHHGAFFNEEDSATMAAFAERLMPGAPGKPGARDAGVLNYIDHALSGAYADLQNFYRRGLAALDAHCRQAHKEPFRRLAPAQQDEVVGTLEQGKAPAFTWPSAQAFFNTVRMHTMEGMFADPIYGGNKDFAGWRLIGFPGAQPEFTAADMQSTQPFTRRPIIGLQTTAKS